MQRVEVDMGLSEVLTDGGEQVLTVYSLLFLLDPVIVCAGNTLRGGLVVTLLPAALGSWV